MPIYTYKCLSCDQLSESIAKVGSEFAKCEQCSGNAKRVHIPTTFGFVGDSSTHFNPHYDMQLGKWFESPEHKKKFLTDTGRVQTSGPLSPRGSSKSLKVCSKEQAVRQEGHTVITKKRNDKYVNRVSGNTHI